MISITAIRGHTPSRNVDGIPVAVGEAPTLPYVLRAYGLQLTAYGLGKLCLFKQLI